jgi:hypothetical protein
MKKLRMVITSVIVLAIVGSAFAFKVKRGAFCVLSNSTPGTNCTTYMQNVRIDPLGSTEYKYYPCWTFDKVQCTAANNGNCTASILTLAAD